MKNDISLMALCKICARPIATHVLFMDRETRSLDFTKAIICPVGKRRTSWNDALGRKVT